MNCDKNGGKWRQKTVISCYLVFGIWNESEITISSRRNIIEMPRLANLQLFNHFDSSNERNAKTKMDFAKLWHGQLLL